MVLLKRISNKNIKEEKTSLIKRQLMENLAKFPKPALKKKTKKNISRRALRKITDGRKDLENECMSLWRRLVAHGKNGCQWCCLRKNIYQAHHIIHKASSAALKYEPKNGIWLCKGCHFKAHNRGYIDFARWLDRTFPRLYDWLKMKKNNHFKMSKTNLELTRLGLQSQLDKLNNKLL